MNRPTLLELAREFFLMGLVSFGAGMFSLIHQRIVQQKKWIGQTEFREGITFSELAPGPFTLHVCMYIGYHLHGFRGLLVTTLFFALPSVILIVLIALLHRMFLEQVPGMNMFIMGVWAAIFAMMLSTILTVGRQVFRSPILILLAVATFSAIYFLELSFFLLIVAAGLLYAVLMLRKRPQP